MSAAAGLDFRRVAAARASTSCARGSAARSWPNLARFAYCRGVRNWIKRGRRRVRGVFRAGVGEAVDRCGVFLVYC